MSVHLACHTLNKLQLFGAHQVNLVDQYHVRELKLVGHEVHNVALVLRINVSVSVRQSLR